MKMLYLDEAGDHSLTKINPDYSVFVIGGIIVDRTYARTVMEPRASLTCPHCLIQAL
jgi:hypothetical protein